MSAELQESNQELDRALNDIYRERKAQDDKWGEQDHSYGAWAAILGEEFGEACQAALKLYNGRLFTRSFDREKEKTLRQELVQVAAVAVAWIECIDRREAEA